VAGIPQTASGVVRLATAEGIEGLRRTLGCTRRQAEQTFLLAQRALATGGVLDLADIPKGTISAATARASKLPTPEPAPFDPEQEAQTRARRIRGLDPSERTRALTELASQIGTAERNKRNGYPAPELAFYERIRELVTNPAALLEVR
jgi:hypothetical protein